jgi:hypothetical protein
MLYVLASAASLLTLQWDKAASGRKGGMAAERGGTAAMLA